MPVATVTGVIFSASQKIPGMHRESREHTDRYQRSEPLEPRHMMRLHIHVPISFEPDSLPRPRIAAKRMASKVSSRAVYGRLWQNISYTMGRFNLRIVISCLVGTSTRGIVRRISYVSSHICCVHCIPHFLVPLIRVVDEATKRPHHWLGFR